MKKIQLYTASPDKNGKRREAGDVLTVGAGEQDDITLAEARKLVGRASAIEYSPAVADKAEA